ncbi:DUF924 family protein [Pseudomonas sp. TTU2014-080ASC]|jgi:uncharacterized protein (DUF924 family)|uniref:DUF924 family protein n=1 Tax=Pseudomonas sp. TTU2014-080ASC TaxID=1729724 RepID=UPI0007188EB7|nr:DUF924 family protein [Pseudomonas sp. TTU2014-080ASC]KRW58977.1 hypothetical protein AO726_15830 [Pseudomonas sp. TTU2014-080ASC]
MTQPWQPVLDWWFGPGKTAAEVSARQLPLWFGKRASQDAEAQQRFGHLVEQALSGQLPEWSATPDGWLAHILLLDQLPRMIYRDTPKAFAGDRLSQPLLRMGLEKGWDQQLKPIQRLFAYLVYEHAEDLVLQDQAVELFEKLLAQVPPDEHELFAGYLDYAERHQRVIARFGRFPHRNQILGRTSSAQESAFLQEPGSSF